MLVPSLPPNPSSLLPCVGAAHVRSELLVLDAQYLARGPVAVLQLRRPLPSCLHGSWSSTYSGPDEQPPARTANVVPFSTKA